MLAAHPNADRATSTALLSVAIAPDNSEVEDQFILPKAFLKKEGECSCSDSCVKVV